MMPQSKIAITPMVQHLLRLALLAAVYYGAARLGLQYASIGESVSLVWPPSGIAFAALTLWGYRYWPGVAIGAFLANLATPIPALAAAGIAVGNTLESLVAAYLLRRSVGSPPQLDDLRHVRSFLVAAAAAMLCAALVGPASLAVTGALPLSDFLSAVVFWWIGDALGALVVAPVFFSWAAPPQAQANQRRLIEVVVLCAGTITAAELALGELFGPAVLREVDYQYLLFPFVIWAALRFGARGAALMTLTVSALAVGHTVRGGSPFVSETLTRTLYEVAGYLGIVAITGLVLASAVCWEREQATRALAQSEARLRLALDAARMGIWFWSVETNSLTWDHNLRQLYGLSTGDHISSYEDFLDRVHPEDRNAVAEAVQRVLDEGGDLDYEFRVVLPDGRVRWIADQGEVRRDELGRPVYVAGVCTDVTERRGAEERLRQAHQMESVGRLAGGVAHETNNQMSVVLGAADFILQRKDIPAEVRTDVEFIRKAAERTAAVTGQLLAYSRRQVLRLELVDVNRLVREWEPVLRRLMGEDCRVVLRLGAKLGPVRADPGQLEQVLLNLALNAKDAMPRGGTITLETFPLELSSARVTSGVSIPAGEYAVLAVSDTGHGMDKETQSHIFEPFFTTKGVGQGTGLGLSMVYGIVKQFNGYIWVYSEPGQGTILKIYLPVGTGAVPAPRKEPMPMRSHGGEKILVVEDEASVRYMMRRALENAGYGVLEAGSAAEALDRISQSPETISLLLTDVVMQGQSGPDLAARIQSLRPGMAVLFTSGYTDGEIARRGLLDPSAAFVQKPLTPEGLVRAVRLRLETTTHPNGPASGGVA